jgi:hypothetical protein
MPISISMEPATDVAVVAASGALSREDAEKAAQALWATREWNGRAAVWDFAAAHFDVSPLELRNVAQFILDDQPDPPPHDAIVRRVTDDPSGRKASAPAGRRPDGHQLGPDST